MMSLMVLLRGAVRNAPQVKLAFGALGVATVVAIVQGFQITPEVTIFGGIAVVASMFILVVFSAAEKAAKGAQPWLLGPAKFLTWSFSILVAVLATCYAILFMLGKSNETIKVLYPSISFATSQVTLDQPYSGTVFYNYPRALRLSWREIDGAVGYRVDVQWRSPPGIPSAFEWNSIPGYPAVTNRPFLDLEFIGANPGRWRVEAINKGKEMSRESEWAYFEFKR